MNTLRRLRNTQRLVLEGNDAVSIAVAHVMANIAEWSPMAIDEAVSDAVKRFKVDREDLDRAIEKTLKGSHQ